MKTKSFFLFVFFLTQINLFAISQDSIIVQKEKKLLQKIATLDIAKQSSYYLELSDLMGRYYPEKALIYAKKALQTLQNPKDSQKAKVYNALSVAYIYNNKLDSCSYYCDKILAFDNSPDLIHYQGNANNLLCVLYRKKGKLNKAIDYGLEAVRIRSKLKDSIGIAGALDNVATVYRRRGEYDKAIAISQKSAKIFEAKNDKQNLAITYYNIADLYMNLEQYEPAKSYYFKVLAIPEVKEMFSADIPNSLGGVFLYTQKLDSALYYFKQALKAYKKKNITIGVAIAYQNIGETLIKKNSINEAFPYLYKSVEIYKRVGNPRDLASVYRTMAEAHQKHKYPDSVVYYYKKANKIAQKINSSVDYTRSLEGLYRFYLKRKDSANAFKYYNQLITYKDSIQLHQTKLKVKELEEQYQNVKKQKEIEYLQNKRKLDKANFKILLIGSISLISFILIGAYILVQKRKKQRQIAELELEKSRIKSESLEEQLSLKNRQLTTHTLNMMQKNRLLSTFSRSVAEIIEKTEGEVKQMLLKLKRQINQLTHSERDWDTFKIYFEQVNKNFLQSLKEITPDLTTNDVRLATLIKLNMSNKEIASILNITHQSVKNSQYRLKKKLKLTDNQNLRNFIASI